MRIKMRNKRWSKRQSCVSNPENKTFRALARASLGNISSGISRTILTTEKDLTRANLKLHDAIDTGMADACSATDGVTATADNMTIYSQFTNETFADLNFLRNSDLSTHKEVYAILAAVTEVIKSRGGTESDVEYFAALMTTLESSSEIGILKATAYLLRLIVMKLPDRVLVAKFCAASKIITTLLIDYANSEEYSFIKSLLGCLHRLLIVQNSTTWGLSSSVHSVEILLGFTVHTKPKIRKMAQSGVITLLKRSHDTCIRACSQFCIKSLGEGGNEQNANCMYVMNLLKEALPYFCIQHIKIIVENLLKIMLKKNAISTALSMEILQSLFLSGRDSNLSVELCNQIVTALYDYRPYENDIQPTLAWLTVMMKGIVCLSIFNNEMGYTSLPRLFSTCMPYFLSKNESILSSTTLALKTVLEECIVPVSEDIAAVFSSECAGHNTPIHKLLRCIESGLKYKYQSSWNYILQIVLLSLKVLGRTCPELFENLLLSICDMYTDFWTPYKKEIENTVATAIKTMGPRRVLGAVSLGLEEPSDCHDFPRSWIIPLLRDNICNTELAYFRDSMLPLAAKMKQKSIQYENDGHELQAKVYKTLYLQIWSLLPGFCTKTTDVVQAFKSIARALGAALTNKELSQIICQAIRLLIQTSCNNDEEKLILKQYAKNYLPILFNFYTESKESSRLYILETIRAYLPLAGKELADDFYAKLRIQLSSDISVQILQSLFDLASVMIRVLDSAAIENLFGYVIHYLKNRDVLVQKKAYKILEEICNCESADARNFISEKVMDIRSLLLDSLSGCSISSKTPRLKCLALICHKLDDLMVLDYVKGVLPEAIWCTKEVSSKTRLAAYALIVEMGKAVTRLAGNSEEWIVTFVKLMLPGVTGSPQMISATINSISCVVFEFREIFPKTLLDSLIEMIVMVLRSKCREAVKSGLGFVKVIIVTFPRDMVLRYLKMIIHAITDWSSDTKRYFRFKAKILFQRMIRKFGYKTITELVPEDYQKILSNIKKSGDRAKRNKISRRNRENSDENLKHSKMNNEGSTVQSFDDLLKDSDDDDIDSTTDGKTKTKRKLKVKEKAAWIKESGNDDGPVDFLDAAISKKILATNPKSFIKKENRGSSKDIFKTTEDGKIIVAETRASPCAPDVNGSISESRICKRKRSEGVASDTLNANNDLTSQASFRSHAFNNPVTKKIKKPNFGIGSEYRSKKAPGDMMTANKYEPYAYIPMNKQTLNKRKRSKLIAQHRGILRATKSSVANARNHEKLNRKKVKGRRKNGGTL